mgnify:FL=1
MKFNIPKFFFKIVLKFYKNFYLINHLKWAQENLESSVFFVSFDFETQKDVDLIERLTNKLLKSNIIPYYAIPGELIKENKKVFRKISKKCTIINHGYKIHTEFDKILNKNKSICSYCDFTKNEITKDVTDGHEAIKNFCNQVPKIFRAPHFGEYSENKSLDFIYNILDDLNYTYSSSTTPIYSLINSPIFKNKNILEMCSSSFIENPLQIIDSWSISNSNLNFHNLFGEFKKTLKLMQTSKFFFNVYFDPSDIINENIFFEHLSFLSKFQKRIENIKIIK